MREDGTEDDPELKSVLSELENKGICTSWKTLKNVNEIYQNLEVLDKLKTLKGKKRAFFKKLFLHPNVSTSAVSNFLEKPEILKILIFLKVHYRLKFYARRSFNMGTLTVLWIFKNHNI